jgi:hypothetical protein
MKVEIKESSHVIFDTLVPGDVFTSIGEVYLKIYCPTYKVYLGVCLESGLASTFASSAIVKKLEQFQTALFRPR